MAEDGTQVDIAYYIALSMSMLLIGVVYWALFLLVKKQKLTRRPVRAFLVSSFLYLYPAINLAFCTLNILSTGGVNSYSIAILIVGRAPVIRPRQSVATIGAALAYVGVIIYQTRDISKDRDSISLTDTWANLIIITGLTSCISVFIYDMYIANFLNSVRLEEPNQELKSMAPNDQVTGMADRYAISRTFPNSIYPPSADNKIN
jgi:hypothetical protein